MADSDKLSPESQEALRVLEGVWKKEQAKGPPARSARGKVNPRLDPTDGFVVGEGGAGEASADDPDAEPGLDMDRVRRSAIDLLATFVDPHQARDREITAEGLVPEAEDFDRIFLPEWADVARTAYGLTYPTAPTPTADLEQTQIILVTARPADLAERGPFSDRFPGAYRRLWDRFQPDSIWASWKYVRPGSPHGMLYDGLVWLDDRWVWVPKPWRLFPRP